MAWIESHQSLRKHPKTLSAVTTLKVDRHKFIGHLQCLWWWGLDVADLEGTLPASTTAPVIADGAEWPMAKADVFVAALLSSGFLEEKNGRFVLHDWWVYAGKYNAKRAANNQRMKDARAEHVQRTDETRAEHVQGLPTLLNSTEPTKPTDLPTLPAPAAKTALRDHRLNLTQDEWFIVQSNFKGVNVQRYWHEWVLWIEKSEGAREPTEGNRIAFEGFLRKKQGELSATGAAGVA